MLFRVTGIPSDRRKMEADWRVGDSRQRQGQAFESGFWPSCEVTSRDRIKTSPAGYCVTVGFCLAKQWPFCDRVENHHWLKYRTYLSQVRKKQLARLTTTASSCAILNQHVDILRSLYPYSCRYTTHSYPAEGRRLSWLEQWSGPLHATLSKLSTYRVVLRTWAQHGMSTSC